MSRLLRMTAATILMAAVPALAADIDPAVVFDMGGKFDKSFNEGVYNGVEKFKKETGITVNEYVTLVRKSMLKEFSKDPNMSRKQMAKQCGLKSERQVIRLLQTL